MKGYRCFLTMLLCMVMLVTLAVPGNVQAMEQSTENDNPAAGVDTDITISNMNVSGEQAGEKVTLHFNVSAGKSDGQYMVSDITKICPVLDETFPFETDNEAYKVINASGTSVDVSYSFKAKDNLETAYYPVVFMITYDRKSTQKAGETASFCVSKSISVKINSRKEDNTSAEDGDISLKVKNTPTGTYDKKCEVEFTVKAKKGEIISVTPVISDGFPFETQKDAYKSITSKGTKSLKCEYSFKVRSDVITGYQMVSFAITYKKNGQIYETTRSINVKLTGKKVTASGGNGSGSDAGNTSTPRLMVAGYDTGKDTVYANKPFTLTVHMENTAKSSISNIKISLVNEENYFIPDGGVSNVFIDSMEAGESKDVTFPLRAASGLEEKIYSLTVKTEYENGKAEAFSSEDALHIPVSLRQRLSVTDVFMEEEQIEVGDTVEISAVVNNLGEGNLYNVAATITGDNLKETETYVGNIEPGKSGTIDILTKAAIVTEGDHIHNEMIITYEDKDGKVYEEKTDIYVKVTEPVYENLEKVKEAKDNTKAVKMVVEIVVVLVVIAAIFWFYIRRKKRKQQILDDFIN
ncbi:MAG: COG1361 S-layer family protein [Lachnospiraceae bacterium]